MSDDSGSQVADATEDEVREYAEFLGIDLETEAHLMWIAREGVVAPVPHPWKVCRDGDDEDVFYFNFETKESIWDHPCDSEYKALLEEWRAKGPDAEPPDRSAVRVGRGGSGGSEAVERAGELSESEELSGAEHGAGRSDHSGSSGPAQDEREGPSLEHSGEVDSSSVGGGAPPKPEAGRSAAEFDRIDYNGDGEITRAEFIFDRLDRNHDGVITREEYNAVAGNRPEADDEFNQIDRNHDGVITREELSAAVDGRPEAGGADADKGACGERVLQEEGPMPEDGSESFVSEAVSQDAGSPANAAAKIRGRMAGGDSSPASSSGGARGGRRRAGGDGASASASPATSPRDGGAGASPRSGASDASPTGSPKAAMPQSPKSVGSGGAAEDAAGPPSPRSPQDCSPKSMSAPTVEVKALDAPSVPEAVDTSSSPQGASLARAELRPSAEAGMSSGAADAAAAAGSRKPMLDHHGSYSARSSNPSEVSEDFRSDWSAPSPPGSPQGHSLELSASAATEASGRQDAPGGKLALSGLPRSMLASDSCPTVPEYGERERGESLDSDVLQASAEEARAPPRSWQELQRDLQALAGLLKGVRKFRTEQAEYARLLLSCAAG